MLALSALIAIVLLWWRVGWGRRAFWIIGSITASLGVTVALQILMSGSLSLFALMACVLVAGLALDYGLFCSRNRQTQQGLEATAHAIRACALSTFAAFAVLALSPIPVLQDIGFVVAAGVVVSYLLMLAGSRNLRR